MSKLETLWLVYEAVCGPDEMMDGNAYANNNPLKELAIISS